MTIIVEQWWTMNLVELCQHKHVSYTVVTSMVTGLCPTAANQRWRTCTLTQLSTGSHPHPRHVCVRYTNSHNVILVQCSQTTFKSMSCYPCTSIVMVMSGEYFVRLVSVVQILILEYMLRQCRFFKFLSGND